MATGLAGYASESVLRIGRRNPAAKSLGMVWYVPGMTSPSFVRSNVPAGTSQVSATAAAMMSSIITSACGMRTPCVGRGI